MCSICVKGGGGDANMKETSHHVQKLGDAAKMHHNDVYRLD